MAPGGKINTHAHNGSLPDRERHDYRKIQGGNKASYIAVGGGGLDSITRTTGGRQWRKRTDGEAVVPGGGSKSFSDPSAEGESGF